MTIVRLPEPAEPGALSAEITIANGLAFVTAIPVDEAGALVGATIEEQSEAAIDELSRWLSAAGSSLDQVVHLTIYLTDIVSDRPAFNEVYTRRFAGQRPVRCAVGVSALARPEMRVELTAIAAVG